MGGRGTWWAVFCLMETQGTSILCDMYFSFLCSSALCLWLLERLSLWQEDGWTLSNNNNKNVLLFFSFIWDMLLKCYHGDIYNTLLSVSTNNQDKLYMLLLPLSFENIYIYIYICYIYVIPPPSNQSQQTVAHHWVRFCSRFLTVKGSLSVCRKCCVCR